MQKIFFAISRRTYSFHTFLFCLAMLLSITSCKKEAKLPSTAALNIINAVVGTSELATNFKGTDSIGYYLAARLPYKSSDDRNFFRSYTGKQRLGLFNIPDTTNKSAPLFDLTLDLPIGSITSLYLTGTVSSPDMLLVKDTLPEILLTDSTMGIRFVNLSQGSGPISVNIIDKANGSEISNLKYKDISRFKFYPVGFTMNNYVFEFRDAASGALIASYTTENLSDPGAGYANMWIYRWFTMALVGKPGGTGADSQSILLINYNWK